MTMSAAASQVWSRIPTATAAAIRTPEQRLALVLPSGEQAPIDEGTTLGQAPSNRVVLEDACVSRRHCVIERLGDRLRVRDLGSKNGTWGNDGRGAGAPLQARAVRALGGG